MALVAWPAWQRQQLASNQWHDMQVRFVPWINGSLVLLLLTGFLQMTADPHYEGFLTFSSLWSQAILLKHIAFVGMVAITVYLQATLYPAMKRTRLLADRRPKLAAAEEEQLARQEVRLLRLNLVCAVVVLFFTAVATAV
jgi:putative copper export protein